MGISGCKSCNCNKNEENNEIQSQIISPKINNIQPQIIENKDNKDINKDKDVLSNSTNSKNNINSFQNQFSNDNNMTNSQRENKNEELRLFIKNLDIRNIYFPLNIDKITNKSQIIQDKIQTTLNKFYPCDDKQMSLIENNLINILYSLKDIILKNVEDENIIHNGNLKKLINFDFNSGKTKKYSDRYCVLYPDFIKYYKSEVQFLKNLKPLSVIYLNQICRVNLVKENKNSKKIDHIILCNESGLKNENESMNDSINNEPFINNESLIIFTSDKEQAIHEWFIIIQYLIERNKN